MLMWDSLSKWRRRGSDIEAPAVIIPTRDLVLEAAIAHEQIDLLFQPLIDIRNDQVIGVEALARSPVARSAEALFGRARAASLDERLSRLIQRKALRCAAAWEGPLSRLRLSINLLPADIARPGYELWLMEEIAASGMDPARVTVEITESALLVDRSAAAARLSRLREFGLRIAVDDFGSGYANLSYLTSLPLDMLKIDRGLIAGIVRGARDRIVVEAIVRMARELGLKVIAEGVETSEQRELLAGWGCDLYQGYLGSEALNHEQLLEFVSSWR